MEILDGETEPPEFLDTTTKHRTKHHVKFPKKKGGGEFDIQQYTIITKIN